jgi:hypothetical protein
VSGFGPNTDKGTTWVDLLEAPEEQATITRLVDAMQEVLRRVDVAASPHQVRLWAQTLLMSHRASHELYHQGASDRQKLERFRKSMEDAARALGQLSPWAAQAVVNVMHQSGDGEFVPSGLETLSVAIRQVGDASKRAEEIMANGPVQGRVKWEAVSLVGDSRRCWQDLSGRAPPERSLNAATPFGEFLQAIFGAIGVEVNAKAAFLSWRKRKDEQISR